MTLIRVGSSTLGAIAQRSGILVIENAIGRGERRLVLFEPTIPMPTSDRRSVPAKRCTGNCQVPSECQGRHTKSQPVQHLIATILSI